MESSSSKPLSATNDSMKYTDCSNACQRDESSDDLNTSAASEAGSNIDVAIELATPTKMNPFSKFAFDSPSRASPGSILGKRREKNSDTSTSNIPNYPTGVKSSPSGSKRVKTYDHLLAIDDHLEMNLDIVFCGINPGEQSAQIGHHYGNATNHFWSCLHESGLTPRKLDPREDHKLPQQFSIGLTNLVDRPTVQQSELSKAEQLKAVSPFLDKVANYRPRILCFVGLGIADIVKSKCQEIGKMPKTKAAIGLQPYKMVHLGSHGKSDNRIRIGCFLTQCGLQVEHTETLFFAVSSTSGRVVRYQKTDKIRQFKDLRSFLEETKAHAIDTAELIPISWPSRMNGD